MKTPPDTSKILKGLLANVASLSPADLRLLLQLLVLRHRPTYAVRTLRKHGLLHDADAWSLASLCVLRYQMEFGQGDHQAMFSSAYSALAARHPSGAGFEPLTADLTDAYSMMVEGHVEEVTRLAQERGLENSYEFDLARLQHLVWTRDFRAASKVIDRRLKEALHSPYFFVCFAKGLAEMGSEVVAADCFRSAVRIEPALRRWTLKGPNILEPNEDSPGDIIAYVMDFTKEGVCAK